MRYIRTIGATSQGSNIQRESIDDCRDPQLLAHAIFNLGGERQEVQYPSYLRVSMLHDVCVRERVLGFRSGAMFIKATNTSMQFTFDLGHSVHHFLQNSNKYFGNKRFGWWQCQSCGFKYFGRYPRANCNECKSPPRAIQYVEHDLKLEEPFRVTGHVDALVEVEQGSIRVLDFKTINGDDFDKLTKAKPDHVIQVSAYMKLLALDRSLPVNIHPTKGFVAYLSKKHTVKTLPIKVFHVERDAITDKYIEDILGTFTRAIKDPTFTPEKHSQCLHTNMGGARAKHCPMLTECQRLG